MRFYLVFFFCFWVHFAIGQSIDSVSKVIFQYEKGHYPFDNPGIYARGEVIEYSKQADASFGMSKYIRFKKSYDSVTETSKTDTSNLRIRNKPASGTSLEKLLIELNTSRDNFTRELALPSLRKPTRRQIDRIARKNDDTWKLDEDRDDRQDRRLLYRQIENFHKLDIFLASRKPIYESGMFVTDNWNRLSVMFIQSTDTIVYSLSFFDFLGQPVAKHPNRDYGKTTWLVNLQINLAIQQCVPRNSWSSKVAALNNLMEDYVKGYLNK